MNERQSSPTSDTVAKQSIAGHPDHSVWVSANAGSGKTHILTERVLRLLLSGVVPENILCLTYTKAAAAVMQRRVADRLSGWSLLDEPALEIDLRALTGEQPNAQIFARARTLFAHALETPGGLKINTIHAFCEAALHRFPLEADVPVDFLVIEEAEKRELIKNARDGVLAEGLAGDNNVAEAVATLFSLLSDKQIEEAVDKALTWGRQLREVLNDPATAKNNLHKLVGEPTHSSIDHIIKTGLNSVEFTSNWADRVFAQTPPDPTKNRFEDKLAQIDWDDLSLETLFFTFLTQTGTVRKTGFPKKSIINKDPELADKMSATAHQLQLLFEQLVKQRLIDRSEALLEVMSAIDKRYKLAKQLEGRLDFDDLVVKFETLLSMKDTTDWVRYKLDAGITHILVDESQDTNPDQWNVVRRLVDDFYDGDSAVEFPRTLFAVGDEKQSIYSFQGADPALFGETGRELALRALSARKDWVDVRFRASFRTLNNILDAVDLVCARPDISQALLSINDQIEHESARIDQGGTVTLWPPVQIETDEKPNNTNDLEDDKEEKYPLLPPPSFKTAPRLLAERIARQIKHWISNKRPLAVRGRAVMADDILILVQRRGPLFKEIIRALKQANLPTPGADVLPVTDHIVVRDLLVLGDVLLNPHDDLALATVLRSPLFAISEIQLEQLCANRNNSITVWNRLVVMATDQTWAGVALKKLQNWRQKLDFDRPYEFFANLLFVEGGLKQFHARLGSEIDDVIGEFLDLAFAHETTDQPSLQGFLSSLRAREISIKRDLSETTGGVRIMSVHGAKGLEAPIVILADATEASFKTGPVYLTGAPNPLLVHASAKPDHTSQTVLKLRQPDLEKQMAEYWRKLYVAMTRAEDELYVTGFLAKNATNPSDNWYEAINTALGEQCAQFPLFGEDEMASCFPAIAPETKPVQDQQLVPVSVEQPEPKPVPSAKMIETIRPSHVSEYRFDPAKLLDTSSQNNERHHAAPVAPVAPDAPDARQTGVILHTLLQHLAPLNPENRRSVARIALHKLLPEAVQAHETLISKALAILSGKYANELFANNSRAEVPLFVVGTKNGEPMRLIGRIDRMIVTKTSVMLVDFKSDAQPASTQAQVSPHYQTQLGLYLRAGISLLPGHTVSAAIFWTRSEMLMPLSNALLLDITKEFKFA